jgi:hypothetical protein
MKNIKSKFDFDDILIVPNINTNITSRYKDIILPKKLPLFTAPMDTVVNFDNMDLFMDNGINVTLPRTLKYEDFDYRTRNMNATEYSKVFISMGFIDIEFYLKNNFKVFREGQHILIDVANGHIKKIIDYAKEIKKLRPDIIIMVGNIANPDTYWWYAENDCVDYIRVGIGNGCFAKGSRILMANGYYKNIENMLFGDEIITMDGNVAKVKRLIPKGKKNVINLKTSMSPKETIVTPDHNYFVGNYNTDYKNNIGYSKSIKNYSWSEINSYNDNITPLFPKTINFNLNKSFKYNLLDFSILKKTTNKYKTEINSNYNIGYIFGTFLGDGNSRIHRFTRKQNNKLTNTTTGEVVWTFNINEIKFVEKLKKCLFEEFNLIPKIEIKKNTFKIHLYNKPLAHLLYEFGKKVDKHLPERYFVNNYNYLFGLYDGLTDSDGNIDINRKSFYNTSLRLVESYNIIYYLLFKTLPNSAIRKFNTSKLIKKASVGYSSRNLLIPERRETLDNKYIINKIISINNIEKEIEVFDLEIDNDTHSFIVDNCIVHNSGCLTTKQSGIGHPMASLIYEVYEQKQRFIEHNAIDIENQYSFLHTKPVKQIPAIIADGGMKDYSDIIKSLALGADYVMIGSIFNKAFESSADNYLYNIKLNRKFAKYFFDKGFPIKKYFRGMSTKEAQKAMGKTHFKTSEGVVRFRKVEYYLNGWIENFEHYLRNAMSYANAKTLDDFVGKVEICQISKNAYDRFNK